MRKVLFVALWQGGVRGENTQSEDLLAGSLQFQMKKYLI